MLIGPRLHDGTDGYLVITPLERQFEGYDGNSTILVCRGWISKDKAAQSSRPEGLPQGEVTVQGLLREPWKKNMFTPDNHPEQGKFYFPDVEQMAEFSGSQPVWIEETMKPDLVESYDREAKGIPIGRAAEVNLRNNHTQYIFTWYHFPDDSPFWFLSPLTLAQVFSVVSNVHYAVDGCEKALIGRQEKSSPKQRVVDTV